MTDIIKKFTLETAITNYIATLNSTELEILELAKQQLETSFSIKKSIGFLNYIKSNNIIIKD